jgi:hypothetical protein
VLERQLNATALQHSLLNTSPPQGSTKSGSPATNDQSCRNSPGARRYVRLPLCRTVPIAALSIVSAVFC